MIAKFKNQVVEVWEVSKTGRVLTGWSRLLKENILSDDDWNNRA